MKEDIGFLKSEVSGAKNAIEKVERNVDELRTEFRAQLTAHSKLSKENFENLSAAMQEIKNGMNIKRGRFLMLRDLGLGGWIALTAVAGVLANLFSGALSGAVGWVKLHFFH